MKRIIYKFKFETGVHLGNRALSGSVNTFQADTLFSALCIEAKKMGGDENINKFINEVRSGNIKISDSFPYVEKTLFIPRPCAITENTKCPEALEYIPSDAINNYLEGKLDFDNVNKILKNLGKNEERNVASIRNNDVAEPYYLSIYRFFNNSGLYIIAEFNNDENKKYFDELMKSLSYTGIGGRVSSGLGKFSLTEEAISKEMNKRFDNAKNSKLKMSISLCLPKESEIKKALEGAFYKLEKRSGFVSSESYSASISRKKDIYVIKSGACFENNFEGDIVDVSRGGNHPVYRYAKPLFMEVI